MCSFAWVSKKRKTNQKQLGRMGELLAALELEGMGYETSLVDAPGYDLIVNYNDRPLRIQVKSGHPFAKNATSKTKRYTYQTNVGAEKRPLGRASADVLCVVASDLRKCLFIIVPKKGFGTSLKMYPSAFSEDNVMQESWEKCLKKLAPSREETRDRCGCNRG